MESVWSFVAVCGVAEGGDCGGQRPFHAGPAQVPGECGQPPVSEEQPSLSRPYVLCGVAPRRTHGPAGIAETKHRTPGTKRTIPQTTGLDNKMVDDSYPVPDD
jgi:hypothetical protein